MTMPPGSKRARQQKGKKTAKKRRKPLSTQNPIAFDEDKLKQLYSTMLRCRMASERARLLVKQGSLFEGLGAATGHEAAEVGALVDLLADDCVAPGRRDLTACSIRGTPLKTIFAQLYDRQPVAGGPAAPRRRNGIPQTMIAPACALSTQLNLVTGVAWSMMRHKKPAVVVAFSGDDSASLGFWRDAVRFSVAHKLPIVHIVHNNAGDGSVSARLSGSSEDPASSPHFSLPTFTVDGNDVVAVYRVAQEAVRRARQGHGPALIECQTYRWTSRLGTDAASRPSSPEELEQSTDPLARMQTHLKERGLWSDKWKQKLVERFSKEIDRAVEFAERSVPGSAEETGPSPLATAS
jgi:TPP-dependent pyruvate/acetoin dehydrogenase alpha subunit